MDPLTAVSAGAATCTGSTGSTVSTCRRSSTPHPVKADNSAAVASSNVSTDYTILSELLKTGAPIESKSADHRRLNGSYRLRQHCRHSVTWIHSPPSVPVLPRAPAPPAPLSPPAAVPPPASSQSRRQCCRHPVKADGSATISSSAVSTATILLALTPVSGCEWRSGIGGADGGGGFCRGDGG